MRILIVAETPAFTRNLAPIAREHWPADDITFVHAVPYGNFSFSYPRGQRLQDFPAIAEPRHRLASWAEWRCSPQRLLPDGELVSVEMTGALFTDADLIVCACDTDHTGAGSFDVLMQQVFRDRRAENCPSLALSALTPTAVREAFAQMAPFGERFAEKVTYGRLKRYFDWNWNHNSLVVLGEVQRRAGVALDAPPLSKYALQLLYGLRRRAPMPEESLHHLMHTWQGTGRYWAKPGSWFAGRGPAEWPRLGSSVSRQTIIDNLLEAKLLASDEVSAGRTQLRLSDRGIALLAQLHPDCEDPDLPFRLHLWCLQGDGARSAVECYIRTFFGKQLRFQAN